MNNWMFLYLFFSVLHLIYIFIVAENGLSEEVDVDDLWESLKQKVNVDTTLPTCVSSVVSLCRKFFGLHLTFTFFTIRNCRSIVYFSLSVVLLKKDLKSNFYNPNFRNHY